MLSIGLKLELVWDSSVDLIKAYKMDCGRMRFREADSRLDFNVHPVCS